MRVLILEDNYNSIRQFHAAFDHTDTISHTHSAAECINHLVQEQWDALFLDHDLGGQILVESGPGTGYEVAEWLERHPDRKPPVIVIHSMNPAGAERMQAALPEALRRPGGWTREFILYLKSVLDESA